MSKKEKVKPVRIGRLGGEDIHLHPVANKLAIELIQSLYLKNQELEQELAEQKAINEIYASQLNANDKQIIVPN